MDLYGNLPQEQAMQRLIHDTNSALQQLHWHIEKLDEWNKQNAKTTAGSTTFILAEYLKSDEKKLKAALDAYYTKFSNDFI